MAAIDIDAIVRTNLERVQERIAGACDKAGRAVEDVKLVGVTKYVGIEETAALLRAGCSAVGESRPQQLWEKIAALEDLEDGQQWHLIGHLQRNKVARTCDAGPLIFQTVDSKRLLSAINKAMDGRFWWAPAYLEVNVSGDTEKHGFKPEDLPAIIEELGKHQNVRVQGLMTMASRDGGQDTARRNFATLRELRDRLETSEQPLERLSMGMSGDFEQAILEGATHIRVGSALWEGIR